MIYLKNKDGKVIGKKSPSKEQLEYYKKEGFVKCDEDGKELKPAKKKVKK